jgi:hypothetical protein
LKPPRIGLHGCGFHKLYAVVFVHILVVVDAWRRSIAECARAGGHSMAAVQSGVRFDKIAEKWHALAQRRLAYVGELARSGRWKWYYAEEQFKLQLREAERAATLWAELAGQHSANATSDFQAVT